MMFGDKKKFNVALVTLKTVGASGEKPGTDDLDGDALKIDPECKKLSAAMDNEKIIKYLEDGCIAINKKAPNNAHTIKKFTILPTDFSTETGELTSTLKLKRSVVAKKHLAFLDSMYNAKTNYVKYAASGYPE